MGALSIVWYVGLKLVSENLFWDAVAALGLMIAFYYGLTGFACAVYYRHQLLKSAKNLLLIGILPVLGGLILTWAFVQSVIDLSDPANSEFGVDWFGLGPPLVITIVFALVGVILMAAQRVYRPAFFRRHPEVIEARRPPPARPSSSPASATEPGRTHLTAGRQARRRPARPTRRRAAAGHRTGPCRPRATTRSRRQSTRPPRTGDIRADQRARFA